MVTYRSREVPRCCGCLTVRSVSLGLALYVLLSAGAFLVWRTVEVARGPPGGPLSRVLLFYLTGVLLLLVALGQLYGVLRGRACLLLPFMGFQALDLALHLLTFCGLFVPLPHGLSYLTPPRTGPGRLPEDPEASEQLRPVLYVALAAATVILLKLYLLQCVWRCYLYLREGQRLERPVLISALTLPDKGLLLPSYEEALALPAKETPPPPYSVQ